MIVSRVEAVAAAKGKNVRQISEETGIRYNTILALFRGQGRRVDLDTIDALCRVLQVQPGELFQYVESPMIEGEEQ